VVNSQSPLLNVNPTTGNPSLILHTETAQAEFDLISAFSPSSLYPLRLPNLPVYNAYSLEFHIYLAAPIAFDEQQLLVPDGFKLFIEGGTFNGGSPALTLTGGSLTVTNATFNNTTGAPGILVAGGALTLRDSTVNQDTGTDQPAVALAGGTIDLG